MTRGSFNTETPLPAATRKFRCHFHFKSPLRGIQSIRRFICCCFATKASLSAATALSLREFVDHLVSTHRFAQRSLCLGARLLTFFQFSNIPNDVPRPKSEHLCCSSHPNATKSRFQISISLKVTKLRIHPPFGQGGCPHRQRNAVTPTARTHYAAPPKQRDAEQPTLPTPIFAARS
ncbi:MAG: hypothetical protein E7590_01630 [Ruminococcaceae bacterium]|nr:hypothetical protein [Oscillospiraceae bacterium]